jgi:hypothetical protein
MRRTLWATAVVLLSLLIAVRRRRSVPGGTVGAGGVPHVDAPTAPCCCLQTRFRRGGLPPDASKDTNSGGCRP